VGGGWGLWVFFSPLYPSYDFPSSLLYDA
jgi:hypothetical protein